MGAFRDEQATYNALFQGYVKVGKVDEMWDMFATMKKRGIFATNLSLHTVISALLAQGRIDDACATFLDLKVRTVIIREEPSSSVYLCWKVVMNFFVEYLISIFCRQWNELIKSLGSQFSFRIREIVWCMQDHSNLLIDFCFFLRFSLVTTTLLFVPLLSSSSDLHLRDFLIVFLVISLG